MKKPILALLALLIPLGMGACARYVVTKNPTEETQGIRFYRPKPYLYVGPPKGTGLLGQVVIQVEYLPDYEEEYAIRVTPGLGSTSLDVNLSDGWNLTSLKGQSDQKYAEIIGSLGNLVSGAAGMVKAAAIHPQGPSIPANAVDAPYGYYESVFWTDQRDKKHLYGWRYIGLIPFSSCPVQACPSIHDVYCDDPDQFWALVPGGGGMKFVKMSELRDHKSPPPLPLPEPPTEGSASGSKSGTTPESSGTESPDKKPPEHAWSAPNSTRS